MTAADPHAGRRSKPMGWGGWLKGRVWAVERAFEKNRAADRADLPLAPEKFELIQQFPSEWNCWH